MNCLSNDLPFLFFVSFFSMLYNPTFPQIHLGEWNMENIGTNQAMFMSNSALSSITGTLIGLKVSLDLSSTKIPDANIFFAGLTAVTTTQTLTLPTTCKYTQAQLADATSKGWTVAGGVLEG